MLRNLQQDMIHAITGTGDTGAPSSVISDHINRQERLNIHRNHYRLSLKQALADNFPVCVALVGEEFFRACMDPFLMNHPPQVRQLHLYGDDVPAFLDGFPPVQQHVAWLGDVARVERAVAASWHGDRHAPLEPALLTRLAPEEAASLTLAPQPCNRLVSSPNAAISVWQAHRDGPVEDNIQMDSGPEYGLVWREGQHILMRQVAQAEFLFLHSLYDGQVLAQAIDAALNADPDFGFAAALQSAFGRGDFYRFGIAIKEPQKTYQGEP